MSFVAVDGGQSALRLTIVGSGTTHQVSGFSYAAGEPVTTMTEAVGSAWADASGAGTGPVERAALGLSGLPARTDQRARLAAAVADVLHAGEVILCADNVTAHAGALPDRYGVALTVGTGVGCLAVDPSSGTTRGVDGWGYLFGDDGSAFAIGRAGVAAVLRAVDGRGPRTDLTGLAHRRYGPIRQIPQRLYTSSRMVDATARFAMDVVAAADAGDGVAVAIVRTAAGELVRTATAAVAALPGSGPVPVTCTGRLIDVSSLLMHTFRSALEAACPRARAVPAAGSGLDGACWLATADDPAPYGPHLYIHRGA